LAALLIRTPKADRNLVGFSTSHRENLHEENCAMSTLSSRLGFALALSVALATLKSVRAAQPPADDSPPKLPPVPGIRIESRAYAQQVHHSLKGLAGKLSEWQLSGASPEKHVSFEPEGLRIKIPEGFRGPQPEFQGIRPRTGLSIGIVAKGDFEVTCGFELLQEIKDPDRGAPGRTRAVLELLFGATRRNIATISRRAEDVGVHEFATWVNGPSGFVMDRFPSRANSGRLRIVRKGTDLSFLVADGNAANFKLLTTRPFVADDLNEVRLVGTTSEESDTLDARFADLTIHADSIQNVRVPQVASFAHSRLWLFLLALAAAVALLTAVWFVARRHRTPPAKSPG
jgi:hypothetical protein